MSKHKGNGRRFALPPFEAGKSGRIHAVIESPRGCRFKYKFDPDLNEFVLHKMLPTGMSFPLDFGFIPGTLGEDGDPLDVLVVLDEPAAMGAVVTAHLLGVVQIDELVNGESIRNDRFIATLATTMNPPQQNSLEDLGEVALSGIETFLRTYQELEGTEATILGRRDANFALRQIEHAAHSEGKH